MYRQYIGRMVRLKSLLNEDYVVAFVIDSTQMDEVEYIDICIIHSETGSTDTGANMYAASDWKFIEPIDDQCFDDDELFELHILLREYFKYTRKAELAYSESNKRYDKIVNCVLNNNTYNSKSLTAPLSSNVEYIFMPVSGSDLVAFDADPEGYYDYMKKKHGDWRYVSTISVRGKTCLVWMEASDIQLVKKERGII